MKPYGLLRKVILLLVCLLSMLLAYAAILNMPVNYENTNQQFEQPLEFSVVTPDYLQEGGFMQLVEIENRSNHSFGIVIPEDGVEFFFGGLEPTNITELIPLEE